MSNRDSLRRRKPFRERRKRFLIVCEGRVTEPVYFKHIRQKERGLIDLEIVPAGAPKSVVELAVERKKADAKRQKDVSLRYDRVWCVFDIDEHPRVPDALDQARANDIEVAVSNPCFELWLLLHFQDRRAHIERGPLSDLCRKHMPRYEKEPPCEDLAPHHEEAIRRARDLEQWQVSRGNPGENPSTGVYRLILEIQSGSRR